MSEFTMADTLELAKSIIRQDVPREFSKSEAQGALRQALIEANGGSSKLDLNTFVPGSQLFALTREIIQEIDNTGLKGDEFWMSHVDYKNVAEGDQNQFVSEDNSLFIMSEIGRGNQAIRRQRMIPGQPMTVVTTPKAIRIYEHLSRVMAGLVDFNSMVQKVGESATKRKYDDIYAAFASIATTTPGMATEFYYTGTYNEDKIMSVIDHVEADSGKEATIIGTRSALRQLQMDVVADQAKEDMYALGYYGRFNGTKTFCLRPRYKTGTREFIIDQKKLWVIAGDDKFIKFVTEGNPILSQRQAIENNDLTQEYWYIDQYGVALLLSHGMGLITLD